MDFVPQAAFVSQRGVAKMEAGWPDYYLIENTKSTLCNLRGARPFVSLPGGRQVVVSHARIREVVIFYDDIMEGILSFGLVIHP